MNETCAFSTSLGWSSRPCQSPRDGMTSTTADRAPTSLRSRPTEEPKASSEISDPATARALGMSRPRLMAALLNQGVECTALVTAKRRAECSASQYFKPRGVLNGSASSTTICDGGNDDPS